MNLSFALTSRAPELHQKQNKETNNSSYCDKSKEVLLHNHNQLKNEENNELLKEDIALDQKNEFIPRVKIKVPIKIKKNRTQMGKDNYYAK